MKLYLLLLAAACAMGQPFNASEIIANAVLLKADLTSVRYPDVNGDGKPDLCYSAPSINQIYCSVNVNGQFGAPTVWSYSFKSPTIRICTPSSCQYTNTESDPSVWTTIQFVDVDLDGKADVCGRQYEGYHCYLSTGHDFSKPGPWTSDFSDAQGWFKNSSYYGTIRIVNLGFTVNSGYFLIPSKLPAVCGRNSQGVICDPQGFGPTGFCFSGGDGCTVRGFDFGDNLGWGSDPAYWSTIQFGDINGDGFADVCGRGSQGMVCATMNQSLVIIEVTDNYIQMSLLFDNVGVWTTQFSDGNGWNQQEYYSTIKMADVNGDGVADVCGRGMGGFYCATSNWSSFSNGSTVVASSFSNTNGWNTQDHYEDLWLLDVNGDGLPDLCGRGNSGIFCQLNESSGGNVQFAPGELWINNFGDNFGWNTLWNTVQPVNLPGGFPSGAFCGVGYTAVWCSSFLHQGGAL